VCVCTVQSKYNFTLINNTGSPTRFFFFFFDPNNFSCLSPPPSRLRIPPTPCPSRSKTNSAAALSPPPQHLQLSVTPTPIKSKMPTPCPRLQIPPTPYPSRSKTNSAAALSPPPQHLQLLATPTPIRSKTPTGSLIFFFFFHFPPFPSKAGGHPISHQKAPLTTPNAKWVLLKWVLPEFGYLSMEVEIQNRKSNT
jgi:hypothetical protein